MTDIATFTNEQLIAVCRADVAEMSKFLKGVNSAIRPAQLCICVLLKSHWQR
jgi:hypothetical protein